MSLSVDTSTIQSRVTGSCAADSSIRVIKADGTVDCETDDLGSGGISGVTAGSGLSGGGNSGTRFARSRPSQIQARVSGGCSVGSSIRVIKQDGTVECQTDDQGLKIKVGSFVTPTSTGNFVVTGVGFTPTYVRFTTTGATFSDECSSGCVDGNKAEDLSIGGMTATYQWTNFRYNSSFIRRRAFEDRCIHSTDADNADPVWSAERVSLDNDAFTIKFNTVSATRQSVVFYEAFR